MPGNLLFFDCFAGISGDMTVGALLDLGCDGDKLRSEIAKLELEEKIELSWKSVNRTGITATKFDIELSGGHGPSPHHRTHRQIAEVIEGSALEDGAKRRALAIFAAIARAEAKIHGVPPEDVHFHEVGAVDSIIDIVAVSVLLEMLAPETIISSPVTLGSGQVRTMHGVYPVPAPATLEILKGAPVRAGEVADELTTPTGAGILAASVDRWGRLPSMEVSAIGYGAGSKVSDRHPNVLRLVLGTPVEEEHGGGASHGHGHAGDHHHGHAHDHSQVPHRASGHGNGHGHDADHTHPPGRPAEHDRER